MSRIFYTANGLNLNIDNIDNIDNFENTTPKKAVKKVKRYPLLESDDEELSESLDSATDAEFEEQQY